MTEEPSHRQQQTAVGFWFWGLGFWGLGFLGLGFRVLGFGVYELGGRARSSKRRASTQARGGVSVTARGLPTPLHPRFILLGFRVVYGAPSTTLNKLCFIGE